MATEVTVLDEAERDRVWQSTLTSAQFRWVPTQGWQRKATLGGVTEWRPLRAGVITVTPVYARTAERFVEVEQ